MSEEERERLLRTRPGNYAELATRLAPRLRPGNQGQQAPRASAPKPSKRPPPGVSKPRPPYVSGSFRSGGPGLLFAARGPRVEGPARAASTPGRWDRRVHVCSLAGVEGIGGTSSGGAVAAPWGALTMGEPCSNPQLGGKGRGEPRSSRRAPKARLCWGLCAAGGRTPLARLHHPEEDGRGAPHPRSEAGECLSQTAHIHPTWGGRGSRGGPQVQLVGCTGPAAWLPAGGHGPRSSPFPWGRDGGGWTVQQSCHSA